MGIPQVAIVGRPNVGKSSVFNWLIGERLAIVDSVAGVTRDRMIHPLEIGNRLVELVDTGGMGIEDVDKLTDHIEDQISLAIDSADVIVFLVDTRTGIAPLDEHVAQRLRSVGAPVICVPNKTDTGDLEPAADEFRRFGWDLVAVSAKQNRGRRDLLDKIHSLLPPPAEDENEAGLAEMKLTIVGRRNVGKSTFINTLVESERMIVSEVPGTTRDSVDVRFELDGKSFIAIDTPGFRRRKSVSGNLEFYGTNRAERSVRRADVVLMFFDAGQQISKVDKQLCDYIADHYKPCIYVVNKWDLMVDHMPTERWADYLRETFRTAQHVPIAFITGQTGKNAKRLLNHAQMLHKQSLSRVSTADLNRLIKAAIELNPPPLMTGHRRPKVYYASQVATCPPTIVFFCNNPKGFPANYQRYLLSVLRDQLPFGEVPIRMFFRQRESSDTRDELKQ
ncbi:MAG: ribosome biogenesis GTPase Der [Planctomycetaceae bacterium]|nr:ribosome biogenesis GTPase Der [Planctomycetaceae bacterium]